MSHVEGLRNFFLDEDNYKGIKRPPGDISFELVTRLGKRVLYFLRKRYFFICESQVWRTDPKTVEREELQGSRQPPRDVAGSRALQ